MQVRDTRITPEGRMLTVEFVGQGGELVSIAMDNSDNNIDDTKCGGARESNHGSARVVGRRGCRSWRQSK